MTNKNSPVHLLKAQADQIAHVFKMAAQNATKPAFKAGIVMDDKVLTIEMTVSTILETTEEGISEYIVKQMRGDHSVAN